ncbi:MAG: single-stranded DNA-binding protein [Treponema sp.]|nr:single-stranded DNA-binding protein [Treponema sp.]
MSDTNTVVLEGRLTANAEMKLAGTTNVVSFTIANNIPYKKDGEYVDLTGFFDCELWGKYGEAMLRHLTKGWRITVTGKLRQNSWKDSGGISHTRTKITVENMSVVWDKKASAPAVEEESPFGDAATIAHNQDFHLEARY